MSSFPGVLLVALFSTSATTQSFVTEAISGTRGVLVCRITSDAREERVVRVEALDHVGMATTDSGRFRLAAGATYLATGGVEARRCRFTVVGPVAGVRAHGLVLATGSRPVSVSPAPLLR
ncbi:MAG: hypothetical protein P8R42_00645 [Candidatus Binatia bacterium]|nr:hypothetical protein [Candidatus Binatia bacterium]